MDAGALCSDPCTLLLPCFPCCWRTTMLCVWCSQPLAYMCVHISLTTTTFALCKLWWASYAAHTAFLLFVFAISAWNGKAQSPSSWPDFCICSTGAWKLGRLPALRKSAS